MFSVLTVMFLNAGGPLYQLVGIYRCCNCCNSCTSDATAALIESVTVLLHLLQLPLLVMHNKSKHVLRVRLIFNLLTLNDSHGKTEGYHTVCVQSVVVSCYLSGKQMTKSNQYTVSTKEDQRLDHDTKFDDSHD